ncbi:Sel1 repeat-containing protein [Nitrosospira multiformis]|uniref:Sel1 repeat-containing protein n=1 Tax=Nitrosospira multiformis TaxID=1231 RepID=A0A1H8EUN3_9PROT|nr:tetratricopeptide repeat protein [Nitrosospira multiformis]SEN23086.1 Sel1 repeat-containing protein [Nitrosospira multiformis]
MLNHRIIAKRARASHSLFVSLTIALLSLTGCATPIPRHSLQTQAQTLDQARAQAIAQDQAYAQGIVKAQAQGQAQVQSLAQKYYQRGFKYETGTCAPKNIEEARRWYQISAQLGNPSAKIGLARLDQVQVQGEVTQNKPAASPKLQNVSPAYVDKTQHDKKTETVQGAENYLLGVRYESGIGVPKSIEEAKKYFRLSAGQGNALAKVRLQELGEEVIKDNDPASPLAKFKSLEKNIGQTIQVLADNTGRELERIQQEAFYEVQRKEAERREEDRRYEQECGDP